MSSATSDVIIVGGGIVGAACARAFARERVRVTLVESDVIGGGATAAGMGHLVVMDDSEAQFALTRYSQDLWRQIVEELPEGGQYQPCGTLWVAADEEEMEAVCRKHKYYTRHGVATEVLDGDALAEAEPNLRGDLLGGLRVPGDAVVYPPCAAQWLVEKARQEGGADIRTGVSAVGLTDQGVQLSDGSSLAAAVTINAAGSWAAKLTPGLPLRPRKGHLVITDRYPGFVCHQLIELGYLKSAHSVTGDSVAFNVQPRSTGQLLIGSSRQYGDETGGVNAAIVGRMIDRAVHYLPRLAPLSALRVWTGFRAATPDKLPMIGPWPKQQRVYLATGHEGLGITQALGTAALLVDEVLGRETRIPGAPYLPSRFADARTHE